MFKILLVKDDETLRDTLALNLRSEGYAVETAADGEVGLTLARGAAPDLVVLDVMLPKLDGLTLCRVLRRESDVPIILLMARGTETDTIFTRPEDRRTEDYVTGRFG